jgi:hypothetical protein
MLGRRGIERVGEPISFGFAKVIDQQIAGDGRDPREERTLASVKGIQGPVHLDENFLGEILSVVGVARKSIADVVDASMMALNDFFPSRSVATDAATDQQSDNLGFFQTLTPGKPCLYESTWDVAETNAQPSTAQCRYVFVREGVPCMMDSKL